MRRSQRFREKAFGRIGIACGTEQKFQGVALPIPRVAQRVFTYHLVSLTACFMALLFF